MNDYSGDNAGQQLRSQALERHLVAGGGSVELLRVEQGQGRIVSFNVILGSGAASKASLEHSRIRIYVDGRDEPVTDLELVDFFFTRGFTPGEGDPTRWLSERVGVSSYYLRTGDPFPLGRVGYYRFVDIPFMQSVLVVLENGDAAHTAQVFSQVEYLIGIASDSQELQLKYQAQAVQQVVLYPGDTLKLLDVGQGAGYIDSVYLSVWEEPGTSFHWPELNLVTRSGKEPTIVYDSSGTEDFFFSSWGWSAGPYAQKLHGHPVHRQNGWQAQYRYFSPGLWFDDGITLTWEPGPADGPELTAGGDIGPIEVWAVITYYLVPDKH